MWDLLCLLEWVTHPEVNDAMISLLLVQVTHSLSASQGMTGYGWGTLDPSDPHLAQKKWLENNRTAQSYTI